MQSFGTSKRRSENCQTVTLHQMLGLCSQAVRFELSVPELERSAAAVGSSSTKMGTVEAAHFRQF